MEYRYANRPHVGGGPGAKAFPYLWGASLERLGTLSFSAFDTFHECFSKVRVVESHPDPSFLPWSKSPTLAMESGWTRLEIRTLFGLISIMC